MLLVVDGTWKENLELSNASLKMVHVRRVPKLITQMNKKKRERS